MQKAANKITNCPGLLCTENHWNHWALQKKKKTKQSEGRGSNWNYVTGLSNQGGISELVPLLVCHLSLANGQFSNCTGRTFGRFYLNLLSTRWLLNYWSQRWQVNPVKDATFDRDEGFSAFILSLATFRARPKLLKN